MTGEGKFFDTLGDDSVTHVPGGVIADGPIRGADGNVKYMLLNFDSFPQLNTKAAAHSAPTGTGGHENIASWPEGTLEYHMLGTQTLLGPLFVATGADVALDLTANDGAEFCPGILACNKCTYTVGTTAAFFAKMTFSQADVSGQDECCFGFRKAEAYQATLDGYDAMAVLNDISGNINIETITDGGSNVTTDTLLNFADGETHTFEVYVSAAGVVTYKVDGAEPTTVAAFSFTDAEVVVPFFYFLHDATSPGAIILQRFECGLQ